RFTAKDAKERIHHSIEEPQPKTKTHHRGTETRRKPRLLTTEVTKEHEGESAEKPVVMKKKALFISGQNPYPCVNNGIERLMVGYEWQIFSEFDVYLLYYRDGHQIQVFHYGQPLPGEVRLNVLLAAEFAFVFLFDFDSYFPQ